MNKLVYVAVAIAAASGIAATPAVAGLSGNPSFSHQLPVRVPSGAQTVHVSDDNAVTVHGPSRRGPSAKPSASRTAEPGEDRAGAAGPGDDRGAAVESGDDRVAPADGNGAAVEPGDDHGGAVQQPTAAPSTAAQKADDRGGAGGNGRGGHE